MPWTRRRRRTSATPSRGSSDRPVAAPLYAATGHPKRGNKRPVPKPKRQVPPPIAGTSSPVPRR
jgi:hypothetical protein